MGHALHHFEEMSELTAKLGDKAAWKNPQLNRMRTKFKAFLYALPEYERAHVTIGAMRIMGERGNLLEFENFVRTFRQPIYDLSATTLNSVRARINRVNRDVVTDIFGEPWQKIEEVTSAFHGMYLPNAIVKDIMDKSVPTPEGMKSIMWGLKSMDFLTDTVKFSLTSPWPAFHFRNTYSNVAQGMTEVGWAAMNPIKHRHAVGVLNGHDGAIPILGEMIPYARIRAEAEEYGVVRLARQMLDYQDAEGAWRSQWRGIMAGDPVKIRVPGTKREIGVKPAKIRGHDVHPSAFGNWVENEARVQLYVHYRMSGITPSAASQAVDNIFFDYRSLSKVDRGVFKRIFPFWVWNKKNIALNARQLKRNPGRQTVMVKVQERFVPTTEEDHGPSEALLPDYLTGALRVGWKHEGKQHFLTGIDFPITSALELAWPGDVTAAWKAWLGMTHPARTLFDVYGWGRDPFTGADTTFEARRSMQGMGKVINVMQQHVPGGAQFARMMEYKAHRDPETGEMFHSVNAAKYHLLMKGSVLSRMVGTTDRLRRYVDEEGLDVINGLLDLLGGFQLREYDLTRTQEMLVKKNQRYLDSLGVRRGALYGFKVTAGSQREVQIP